MRLRLSPMLGALALSLLVLHAVSLAAEGGLERWTAISGWTVAAGAALAGTLAAALRARDPRLRRAWSLWAVASGLWLAGALYRASLGGFGDFSASSLAAVPLLLSPLVAAAGVAYRLPDASGQFRRFALDAVPLVALAAGASWVAYGAELATLPSRAVALAYPVAYGLLAAIGLQLVLAYGRGSRPASVSALATGFAVAAAAAIVWPAQALTSGVSVGHASDGLWSLALLGFAAAGARRAAAPDAYQPIVVPTQECGRRGLPAIGAVLALIGLLHFSPVPHHAVLLSLLLLAVLALVLRFYLVREELGRSLRDLRESTGRTRVAAARFRAIFDEAPVGCVLTDLSGQLIETNTAFREMLGLDAAALAGRSFSEFTHPDDIDADVALLAELVAGDRTRYEIDKRYLRGDGVVILGRLAATLLHDEAGSPQFCLGVVEDVTARTEIEQRVREAEEKYRTLVENLPLVSYIDEPNPGSTAIYISPQIVELLGYPVEEWLADPDFFEKVLHPDDRAPAIEEHAEWLETGGLCTSEYRLVSQEGQTVWVRDQCVLVRSASGEPLYVQGYLADITDLKTLELERARLEGDLRQAQKLEAIGRLSGGIAHDFNNLLTAIGGYAEVLKDYVRDDREARGYAAEIQTAADRAAALTRQLLAFARRQVLRPAPLELGELVADMRSMLRRLIGEDIEIVCAGAPAHVLADRGQLEQVVMNLALNARDAMPDGGTLILSTGTTEGMLLEDAENGGFAVLEVSDTGCGIEPEHLPQIFEPFFTTKDPGKGTGLGLSTVHGIVSQSHGKVDVESVPGRGTTFRIHLPLTTDEPRGGAREEESKPVPSSRQETILLVEDESSVRSFVRDVLEAADYTVLEAADASAAFTLFETHADTIDLILTDVVMPGESGPELVQRVAAVRSDIEVVYMSGYSDVAVRREGRLDDTALLLEKPFTIAQLTHAVRDALLDAPTAAALVR